ncbi:ABC transporter substrate-binding protein [Vallitalea pronyensis]|uniref:ABC transporter substrate-binding protein n=1 Tax=Vallitalea pronyensis TaxID=1348613 RepID=A0A8J8MHK6_9FIRM|nr:ABC transporter substrate-binding protein [Vallitalea pronyensis]QUI21785.1 ABC transporter substrate-binding protein [Vallitalea pronyensis]
MKKLISCMLVIMMILSVAGCGQSDAKKKDEDSNQNVTTHADAETTEGQTGDSTEDMTEQANPSNGTNLYPDFIIEETETTITYVDKFGTETMVTKKPEKVVIAFNSILGLWYYAGGTSLTKVKGSTNVPEEAKDLMDLGSSRSVSLEAIIALEPDLVILAANVEGQVALAPTLKESGIEAMIIDTSINAYERFKENAYLFSKINGTEEAYDTKVQAIITEIDGIIEKAQAVETKSRVAAMFATSKSMSLDSDMALTGEMIYALGGENILNASDVKVEGESRVPFSIEALITQNPEIIMISTMGDIEGVKENVNKMIDENPAWNQVHAVENNRVYYLPKEYSVYKPNEKYAEAFTHIAKLLYPDVFGE